ncbi:MAG: chorismate synthase [Candidatus Altiarchaeum hamiconexum]|uniref:Chorismate synthase n=1 Tax=Candidatus Altarchaeum hamiconexum TaxID=1803513 RepID=A0A8J7Z108_9ARCH|nr:chorismate synthase [Candidatus Altarchaeum hamiconexum]OIQ04999.1 MAG: chorismate synthase [Candidatus Altarchaeum sp. CG2_30_32_3053]PIN67809.1 MAG: chorismate synthase [Candidatus Altarchaeum sp. CG12_big_fil_rev_8_21_14_0_65_33_22]PIV28750.1 MAG: chorismate synthase [Candidatus Altarchaeum sp. CG03_land_8_20_14_0_80_32_618]PIX48270.1 MAG: chorismate synthase [Candidatus Altarchaeum sp. CG_4_8_14_3_um_filter_33_2054]PIZ32846.1 MAG: chorismate synthase [Candidatus Altarchaeum sp. CG_4_10_
MNTFGEIFTITTFGESHGKAIGVVIDGCPGGIEISKSEIQHELDKRKPGQSEISTHRKEEDTVEILSGIFEGKTLGTPIAMMIYNKDARSSDYDELKFKLRPGHADWTYKEKFGHIDYRGGGRSSARETACRVAAGAIAKKILNKFKVDVFAYVKEIANIESGISYYKNFDTDKIDEYKKAVEKSDIRCIDVEQGVLMRNAIIKAKNEGESVGGIIEILVLNLPSGIGEPVYGKLGARLAYALMSIPAAKGFETGKGFELSGMKGSEANDEFCIIENKSDNAKKIFTKTNNCGGILGGISNRMPVVVRLAIKPTSSISKMQNTVDIKNFEETTLNVKGRHDPCIVPRAVPVAESMVAITIVDLMMQNNNIPKKF